MDNPTNKDLQDLLYNLMDQNTQILVENTHIKKSLEDIVKVNKNLLEENLKLKAKLEEVNKKLEIESLNGKKDRRKWFSHFKEEIKQLKACHESPANCAHNVNFSIPIISSADEIIDLDSKIEYDDKFKNQVSNQFKVQPCDDVKKFIWENLKILFRNDYISSQFSWLGANRNISAKDMNFIQLLKDVTLQQIPSTTETIVEQHIKTFFNLVKDRINKRNKRKRDPLD